jgi:hypothetical protein
VQAGRAGDHAVHVEDDRLELLGTRDVGHPKPPLPDVLTGSAGSWPTATR